MNILNLKDLEILKVEEIAKALDVTAEELMTGKCSEIKEINLGSVDQNGVITVNCHISELSELDVALEYIEKIRERTVNAVIDINVEINR